jgi:hypothetical protein
VTSADVAVAAISALGSVSLAAIGAATYLGRLYRHQVRITAPPKEAAAQPEAADKPASSEIAESGTGPAVRGVA